MYALALLAARFTAQSAPAELRCLATGHARSSFATKADRSSDSKTSDAVEGAAEAMEGAAADAVQRLHPAFTTFINSGYLESQRQLRDRLLKGEWDETVKEWALRNGVAEFQKYVVEHGEEKGIKVSWDDIQKLYANPEDLSPLADNEPARLMAQAVITQADYNTDVRLQAK
eukprot:GHUV01029734.1.p1 GENE.GHUV01029734.1~~GHUV01029734.1.p1  ORF type:complete len:172 (+),score=47.53 GHUV01029734.1:539-1054(+)